MSGRPCRFASVLGACLLVIVAGCVEKRDFRPITPPAPSAPVSRLPQNNAYVGSIHSPRPGALQPRFAWTAAATEEDDPITYKLELAAARDFSGEVLEFSTQDTSFVPPAPLAVSMTPPVGRRYFWRVRACLPLICSEPSAVRWINLGRSDHDYNGDGYADVLVGAPNDDGNGQDAGRAYVYFGGPGASLDSTPDGVLAPSTTNDAFGESVASVGDFDGDGYADVVIGASYRFGQGVAFIFFGGFGSTFDPTPDVILGDGGTYQAFGRSVSAVGDVNGDGYDDVLVGSPGGELGSAADGAAFLYLGNRDGKKLPAISLNQSTSGKHFGEHVSALGDINGDGLADFAASTATLFIENVAVCHAFLYLGRTDWESNKLPNDEATHRLVGCRLNMDAAGDVNHDGFSDVLQGAGNARYAGFSGATVTLLLGTEAPKWPTRSLFVTTSVNGMAGIGDVNGDSFADFAVSKGAGTSDLEIYFGADRLPSPVMASASLKGQSDQFGWAMSGAGDLNGDGLGDLIVGDSSFSSFKGAAYVYFGLVDEALKFDFTVDGMLTSSTTNASFGYAVASAAPDRLRSSASPAEGLGSIHRFRPWSGG